MPVYDAATALLVVDVQNDFADPRGRLFVPEGDRVVAVANEAIRAAREAGALVVATQDWHPEHTRHFAQDGGIWPVHCVHDTWGAELHAELEPIRDVVRKGVDGKDGYSGFSVRDPETGEVGATPLEEVLRAARIERLVVCGLATDYCVVQTVSDARMLGYPVEVLGSAIRAVDLEPGDGDRAIGRIRDAGAELV
jgi:nicotinamidase/pyrazinamidase